MDIDMINQPASLRRHPHAVLWNCGPDTNSLKMVDIHIKAPKILGNVIIQLLLNIILLII